jgi:hypothetical protein
MNYGNLLIQPDTIALFVVQGSFLAFVFYAMLRRPWIRLGKLRQQSASLARSAGGRLSNTRPMGGVAARPSLQKRVMRNDSWSLAKFYGVHAISLSILLYFVAVADITAGYRVIAGIIDMLAISYLAFVNGWFRNKLLLWLAKLEKKQDKLG